MNTRVVLILSPSLPYITPLSLRARDLSILRFKRVRVLVKLCRMPVPN